MLKQNIFRSVTLARAAVKACSVTKSDVVYEIEPENGIITSELATAAGEIVVMFRQLDRAKTFEAQIQDITNVEVRVVDLLHYEDHDRVYKVFANVTVGAMFEMIIDKALRAKVPPVELLLIMQEPTANRYSGDFGETEASVLLKPQFDVTILSKFRGVDFRPPSSTDIVLLSFRTRIDPLISQADTRTYRHFVQFSFDAGVKGLDSGYRHIFTADQWRSITAKLGVRLSVIPTELTFDQWLRVFECFKKLIPESKRKPLLKKVPR